MARGHVWQGGMSGKGACLAGGHVWQGGMSGKGACLARGHVWQGGMSGKGACVVGATCMAGETASAVNGMHPTGMHSCVQIDNSIHVCIELA